MKKLNIVMLTLLLVACSNKEVLEYDKAASRVAREEWSKGYSNVDNKKTEKVVDKKEEKVSPTKEEVVNNSNEVVNNVPPVDNNYGDSGVNTTPPVDNNSGENTVPEEPTKPIEPPYPVSELGNSGLLYNTEDEAWDMFYKIIGDWDLSEEYGKITNNPNGYVSGGMVTTVKMSDGTYRYTIHFY